MGETAYFETERRKAESAGGANPYTQYAAAAGSPAPQAATAPAIAPPSKIPDKPEPANLDWVDQYAADVNREWDAYMKTQAPSGTGVVTGTGYDDVTRDPQRTFDTGGGYAPAGGRGGHVPFDPSQAIARPDRPAFSFESEYDLPDYDLPDEDQGVYKAAYADATSGYMKEVRNASMQAIFSARSSQNPNERAMLVEAALSGAGKAYESIGRAGTQAAKSEAARARAEQISQYDKQWAVQEKELDKKYQAEWQSAIYDFGAQQQEYATDYAAYASQPKDLRAVADKKKRPMTTMQKEAAAARA